MGRQPEFKVCGLTRVEDARAAYSVGASYLGFILFEKSPRYLSLPEFDRMRDALPDLQKVAVVVSPSSDDLDEIAERGFEKVQIHYPARDADRVAEWSKQVGRDRLWLVPKLGPGDAFLEIWTEMASGIGWDAFKKEEGVYGGTGSLSDWERFAQLRQRFPECRWILAGGLSPSNMADAIERTGADVLDFNSGVEESPGQKDQKKLAEVGRIWRAVLA